VADGLASHQHTIGEPVAVAGIGLHSAAKVNMRLLPAPANTGVVFRRIDLDNFEIPASWKHIARVSYATSLMRKSVLISTTEHLLSALVGMEIDNVIVELDALELPIIDGSALPFVRMIETAGRRRQRALRSYIKILKPVEVIERTKRIAIYPCGEAETTIPSHSTGNLAHINQTRSRSGFHITSEIEFPHQMVGIQSTDITLCASSYPTEIAPARTFGFFDELPAMRDMGLIRGGSLENAVVFGPDGLLNPEGLRFSDECSRHKVLDLIGDLSLLGHPILGHVIAERAGHAMHTALVLKLMRDRSSWTLVTADDLGGDSAASAENSELSRLPMLAAGTD
jgi:UDP-3-O-[3-hydroxymyristoyl] N-acetylglucosamine deacetylase